MIVKMADEVIENPRVEQGRDDFAAARRTVKLSGKIFRGGFEIGRREARSRAPADRLHIAKDALPDACRKAAGRLSHAPGQKIDDALGKRQLAVRVENVLGLEIVGQEK